MNGPLHTFFAEDHRRLNDLLGGVEIQSEAYDMHAYAKFRSGLLKHIKMEETILFPALEKSKSGMYTESIVKLRLDHGALTALMVPAPSSAILKAIRFILTVHNQFEEKTEGLYNLCDDFIQNSDEVLHKVEQTADVPVLAHRSEPFILEATRRALARAGYNFDDFETR